VSLPLCIYQNHTCACRGVNSLHLSYGIYEQTNKQNSYNLPPDIEAKRLVARAEMLSSEKEYYSRLVHTQIKKHAYLCTHFNVVYHLNMSLLCVCFFIKAFFLFFKIPKLIISYAQINVITAMTPLHVSSLKLKTNKTKSVSCVTVS
jgi:hypothetical protein